jgi:hypothetical protein
MLLPPLLYVMLSVPFVSVRLPHVLAVWLTLQLQLRTASKLVSLRRMVVARYRLWDRLGDVPARRNEAVSVRRSLDAVALCHATWSVIKVLPPDIARVELAKRAAAMRAVVSLADATRVYVAHRALWSRWTSCPPSYVRSCDDSDAARQLCYPPASTVLGRVACRCRTFGCCRGVP